MEKQNYKRIKAIRLKIKNNEPVSFAERNILKIAQKNKDKHERWAKIPLKGKQPDLKFMQNMLRKEDILNEKRR